MATGQSILSKFNINQDISDGISQKIYGDDYESIKKDGRRCLQAWYSALPPDIKELVVGAENQTWPFLPNDVQHKWMFEDRFPSEFKGLTHMEILLRCLGYAIQIKDYQKAAALCFVVDRFMYRFGGSKVLLDIVDTICQQDRSLILAPQVIIRKTRVMKDTGDLHGAMRILDSILDVSMQDQKWKYKKEVQFLNVRAVCVQIKGHIFHNLGLWKEAIPPLVESVHEMHQIGDEKGVSSSLLLLSKCLNKMTPKEFEQLKLMYRFNYSSPYYEGYFCGSLAVYYAPYDSLFLAKHQLVALESLLMYTVSLGMRYDNLLINIIQYLKMSLASHKTLKVLESNEQFFEFIKAAFIISIALHLSSNEFDQQLSRYFEELSLLMYQAYSVRQQMADLHDRKTLKVMNAALRVLGLPALEVGTTSVERNMCDVGAENSTAGEKDNPFQVLDFPEQFGALAIGTDNSEMESNSMAQSSDEASQPEGFHTHLSSIPTDSISEGDGKVASWLKEKRGSKSSEIESANFYKTEPVKMSSEDCLVSGKGITVTGDSYEAIQKELKVHGKRYGRKYVGIPADPYNFLRNFTFTSQSEEKSDESSDNIDVLYLSTSVISSSENSSSGVTSSSDLASTSVTETSELNSSSVSSTFPSPLPTTELSPSESDSDVLQASGSSGSMRHSFHMSQFYQESLSILHYQDESGHFLPYKRRTNSGIIVHPAIIKESDRPTVRKISSIDDVEESADATDCSTTSSSLLILTSESVNVGSDTSDDEFTEFLNNWKPSELKAQNGYKVKRSNLWVFNPENGEWSGQSTLAVLGPEVMVKKPGSCRKVFEIKFLHQDEPLGRYVAKRYKIQKDPRQYLRDTQCQLFARYYVIKFNQALQSKQLKDTTFHVHYLPVYHLQLLSATGELEDWVNVEPFLEGEFDKVTNNLDACNKNLGMTKSDMLRDICTAISHFTCIETKGHMMLVDIQGFLPKEGSGIIYLTDPQFHTRSSSFISIPSFGSADRGEYGMKAFWETVHPKCNEICTLLNLPRP